MKNKLNKNFWNKHGHVVIIYVFLVALMLSCKCVQPVTFHYRKL